MKLKLSPYLYRVLIAGVVILLGLYLTTIWYAHATPEITVIPVKNATANISEAIKMGLNVNVDGEVIKLSGEEIKNWTEPYTRTYSGQQDIRIDGYKILEYVSGLAPRVNSEWANAKFEITPEGKVAVFQPAMTGKKLDIHGSVFTLITAIRNGNGSANLVIETKEPEITLEKVNNLGINTLLSKGESNFSGSSSSRIHNIRVGMAKFNGILLKPGEEFSFNKLLGEVDRTSGYRAELVIKGGNLVYEYGGGICQVSTTLFRSIIYAGLPIVERRPHSIPVRYYNPQGFDATIYPGITDFRFTNDTPNHILIQNKIVGANLIFEIYGSNDGRIVTVQGPYQYDQRPSGAMKAYFTRSIAYNDLSSKSERFDSAYKAPFKPQEKNPLE